MLLFSGKAFDQKLFAVIIWSNNPHPIPVFKKVIITNSLEKFFRDRLYKFYTLSAIHNHSKVVIDTKSKHIIFKACSKISGFLCCSICKRYIYEEGKVRLLLQTYLVDLTMS